MAKILISGGNGLLGRAITKELLHNGHEVSWLCRTPVSENKVKVFLWDPVMRTLDIKAFEGIDHLINLSGSNIAGKPWNAQNKAEIYNSRIHSTAFLLESLQKQNGQLTSICGASATGFYGTEHEATICTETELAGTDFLAQVCKNWEDVYSQYPLLAERQVILRIGIVLSNNGGLYAKLRPMFRAGLAAVIGKGTNYVSWIHVHDLARLFAFAIDKPGMHGTYNATASEPLTFSDFTHAMAKSLNRKVLFPRVPGFLIRLLMGERAALLIKGCRADNRKIRDLGFSFEFPELFSALQDLATQKIQVSS